MVANGANQVRNDVLQLAVFCAFIEKICRMKRKRYLVMGQHLSPRTLKLDPLCLGGNEPSEYKEWLIYRVACIVKVYRFSL